MKIRIEIILVVVGVFLTSCLQSQTVSVAQQDSVGVNSRSTCEFEVGALATQNIEFRGYRQGNATENWKSTSPSVRFEYWKRNEKRWNYGFSIQPVYFRYSDLIRSDLNYKGKVYHAGERASLIYQFHNATASANYPLFYRNSSMYFRLGGTLIYRYADIYFRGENNSFHDKNFIIFPLLNTEFSVRLFKRISLFTRADFLPSLKQNVFLDGLFSVYTAIRTQVSASKAVDLGVRLFFGGYDEQKADDYAQRTFFFGVVARYSF